MFTPAGVASLQSRDESAPIWTGSLSGSQESCCRLSRCFGTAASSCVCAKAERVLSISRGRLCHNKQMRFLAPQLDTVNSSMPFGVAGTVQAIVGLTVEASDLALPLGSLCRIDSFGQKSSLAEVIGFRQDRTLLMPLS